MRIFAAVGSWIIWTMALICVGAAIYYAVKKPWDPALIKQPDRFKSMFLIICSFLMGVAAFIARKIMFFHKRHVTLDEIGGVFLWLCLSGFMASLSFGALVPGLGMMMSGEAHAWAYVGAGLAAILLFLGLPLLPPDKAQPTANS